jgi:hypothetical protein
LQFTLFAICLSFSSPPLLKCFWKNTKKFFVCLFIHLPPFAFLLSACLPSCLGYGSSSTRRSFQKTHL